MEELRSITGADDSLDLADLIISTYNKVLEPPSVQEDGALLSEHVCHIHVEVKTGYESDKDIYWWHELFTNAQQIKTEMQNNGRNAEDLRVNDKIANIRLIKMCLMAIWLKIANLFAYPDF